MVKRNGEGMLPASVTLFEQYEKLMRDFRAGKYGTEPMVFSDILNASGNEDLFNGVSIEEVDECIEKTTGFTRAMFLDCKKAMERKQGFKQAK